VCILYYVAAYISASSVRVCIINVCLCNRRHYNYVLVEYDISLHVCPCLIGPACTKTGSVSVIFRIPCDLVAYCTRGCRAPICIQPVTAIVTAVGSLVQCQKSDQRNAQRLS